MVVDLDRPEEAIWDGVHPKWRKAVRRSERDGLTVVSGGVDRIPDFHRIHQVSMDRVGLYPRTEQSFRELFEAFREMVRVHHKELAPDAFRKVVN